MPEAYDVHDGLFIQELTATSAANALLISSGYEVPANRVATVLLAEVFSSIAETQNYWFAVYNTKTALWHVCKRRVNAAVGVTSNYGHPLLEEGLEFKLWPGDKLYAYRDVATAGSSLSIAMRYIETDIQYYVELDKHKVLQRRMSVIQETSPQRRGTSGSVSGYPRTSRPSAGRRSKVI